VDQTTKPGMYEALINAVRGFTGMGAQQTTGRPTDVAGGYRQYLMSAAERGEEPLSLRDWQNSQSQMPVSSQR
jgi:hypothetical protein